MPIETTHFDFSSNFCQMVPYLSPFIYTDHTWNQSRMSSLSQLLCYSHSLTIINQTWKQYI